MKEKKKGSGRTGTQALGNKEDRQERIDNSLNLSSPFINQNRVNAEFNELFNSVVDRPEDLFTEYGQQETNISMEAAADPGGMDHGYEERARKEMPKNLKWIGRRKR